MSHMVFYSKEIDPSIPNHRDVKITKFYAYPRTKKIILAPKADSLALTVLIPNVNSFENTIKQGSAVAQWKSA